MLGISKFGRISNFDIVDLGNQKNIPLLWLLGQLQDFLYLGDFKYLPNREYFELVKFIFFIILGIRKCPFFGWLVRNSRSLDV